jgi:hypothetical protein
MCGSGFSVSKRRRFAIGCGALRFFAGAAESESMRTLILMRHAKAVRAHEADSDEARGLTGRGRREAPLPVRRLRMKG